MPKTTLQTIQKRIETLLSQARRLKRKKTPALRRIVSLIRGHGISLDEIRASADRHRSPMILRGFEDWSAGKRFPLDLITHYA